MKRLLFTFFTLSFFANIVYAQQEDFSSWYNLSVNGELFKKLDFSIEPELRIFENSSQLESWQMQLNLSTKVKKWLDVGLAYRYQVEYDDPRKNERIHRIAGFSKFGYKTGKLRWSYRAQIQSEQANINSSEDGYVKHIEHRHKIGVKYRNKKWFCEPSVGIEYFFCLAPSKDKNRWKNRLFVTIEKDISKRISGTISYKRQEEFNVANPDITNIIQVGIEYKPKWLKIK